MSLKNMNNCGIYTITNVVNNKVYVGQSINLSYRIKDHTNKLNCGKHKNPHLQNAWNKYGNASFKFEIVTICLESELNMYEIEFINKFSSNNKDHGYNLREGGKSGGKISQETKDKLRLANLGKILKKETKHKITKWLLKHYETNDGHMSGKKHSDKTKQKMSEIHAGSHHSDESKNKIRNSKLGKLNPNYGKPMPEHVKSNLCEINKNRIYEPHTKETKEKMRLAKVGRSLSEETRQKLREKTLAYWTKRKAETPPKSFVVD